MAPSLSELRCPAKARPGGKPIRIEFRRRAESYWEVNEKPSTVVGSYQAFRVKVLLRLRILRGRLPIKGYRDRLLNCMYVCFI